MMRAFVSLNLLCTLTPKTEKPIIKENVDHIDKWALEQLDKLAKEYYINPLHVMEHKVFSFLHHYITDKGLRPAEHLLPQKH